MSFYIETDKKYCSKRGQQQYRENKNNITKLILQNSVVAMIKYQLGRLEPKLTLIHRSVEKYMKKNNAEIRQL